MLLKKLCPLVLFTQVLFIYASKAGSLLFSAMIRVYPFGDIFPKSMFILETLHYITGLFGASYGPIFFNSSQVNRHYIPGLFLFQFINGHLSCFRLLRTVSRLMCFYDFSGKSLISPKYVFIMLVLRNEEFNLFC